MANYVSDIHVIQYPVSVYGLVTVVGDIRFCLWFMFPSFVKCARNNPFLSAGLFLFALKKCTQRCVLHEIANMANVTLTLTSKSVRRKMSVSRDLKRPH